VVDTSGTNAVYGVIGQRKIATSPSYAIKSYVRAIVHNLHRTIDVATRFWPERTTSLSNSCRHQNE